MQAPFVDPLSGIPSYQHALPLIDRVAEMQLIRMVLNNVLHNVPHGPRALTISGDIGVGKTRLLAELHAEAKAQGFRVLGTRVNETGSSFPYQPFIELLRPFIRRATPTQLRRYTGLDEELLQDSAFANANNEQSMALIGVPLVVALARLFPELLGLIQTTVEDEVLSDDSEKFRLLDAFAIFLERVAREQSLVLSIDNLQWADSASLELTVYLTVRLHDSRIALIGASRPPAMFPNAIDDTDLAAAISISIAATKALSDLVRHGLLALLPIGPLDEDASAAYLHALLPGSIAPHIAHILLNRAEGNPFFLEELVRMLTLNQRITLRNNTWSASLPIDEMVPNSITVAVEQRLQGMSQGCREMLRVAALFGRTFLLDALAQVVNMSPETVEILLDEASRVALIAKISPMEEMWDDEDISLETATYFTSLTTANLLPTTYSFCQSIVLEVLCTEMPQKQSRTLHGKIGAVLEVVYGKAVQTHAAELAQHYVLSGEREAALRWSVLAGEEAARKQAHREAISHFRLALTLLEAGVLLSSDAPAPSPAQLYVTIGSSWFKLGQLEQAISAFHHALDSMQPSVDMQTGVAPLLVAQANRQLSDAYRMQGKYEQARTHMQAARIALNKGMESMDVQEQADSVLSQTRLAPWFIRRTAPGSTQVLNLRHVSINERILLLQAQATLDLMHFHSDEAEAALWESHRLATEVGDRSSQAFALHFVGWIRGWGESIHVAIRYIKQANALYIANADPFRAVLGDQALGIIYTALGEMAEAKIYTERGLERSRRYGVRYHLGWLYWNQGISALCQGNWADAESYLSQAWQEVEVNDNIRLKPVVLQAQAELHFRRGNWQEAERLFLASISAASATEWYVSTLALYGHFLAVTGRRAAAREQLDLASVQPEPLAYAGDFYIPFLAEGYIHLGIKEKAAVYIGRIRKLRGFIYYGNAVDRILGVVGALANDWDAAERAFTEGLALCHRTSNQPEEAAILYEQARAALLQSGLYSPNSPQAHLLQEHVKECCNRARALFMQYEMLRSVTLVNTLQEGATQLHESRITSSSAPSQQHTPLSDSDYTLHLSLTKRELDVLRLVAEGHTDREVADILAISPRTVNRHLSNVFFKLNVPSRAAAVAYSIRLGVV